MTDAADRAEFAATHDRVADAIREHLATGTPARRDWRTAIEDAVTDLDQLAARLNHPDLQDRAHNTMRALLGIWLDPDEIDQVTHPA